MLDEIKQDYFHGQRVTGRGWGNLDGEQISWLIKQAELVNKIRDFCKYEHDIYTDLKTSNKHELDRILFDGKQKAFFNVLEYIESLSNN